MLYKVCPPFRDKIQCIHDKCKRNKTAHACDVHRINCELFKLFTIVFFQTISTETAYCLFGIIFQNYSLVYCEMVIAKHFLYFTSIYFSLSTFYTVLFLTKVLFVILVLREKSCTVKRSKLNRSLSCFLYRYDF